MSLSSVLSSIRYWNADPQPWNMLPSTQLVVDPETSADFRADFGHYITLLYSGSNSMRALLDANVSSLEPLRVAQHLTLGGQAFAGIVSDKVYAPSVGVNFDIIGQTGDFNDHGEWVLQAPELVIAHELYHLLNGAGDVSGDPNSSNYDFKGPTVEFQNIVASELDASGLGFADAIRSSYSSSGPSSDFQVGLSYTNGEEIDISRVNRQIGNNILTDTSSRLDNSRDLIFGNNGNDIIKSGGGNDYLYGRLGADILDAGSGDDLLVGGDGNDIMIGGAGNDEIWGGDRGNDQASLDSTDTVDYSSNVASAPVHIDFDGTSPAPVITVQDGLDGTDTLHSIERIIGTTGEDTFSFKGTIPNGYNLLIDSGGGAHDKINLQQSADSAGLKLYITKASAGEGYIQSRSGTGGLGRRLISAEPETH